MPPKGDFDFTAEELDALFGGESRRKHRLQIVTMRPSNKLRLLSKLKHKLKQVKKMLLKRPELLQDV